MTNGQIIGLVVLLGLCVYFAVEYGWGGGDRRKTEGKNDG